MGRVLFSKCRDAKIVVLNNSAGTKPYRLRYLYIKPLKNNSSATGEINPAVKNNNISSLLPWGRGIIKYFTELTPMKFKKTQVTSAVIPKRADHTNPVLIP